MIKLIFCELERCENVQLLLLLQYPLSNIRSILKIFVLVFHLNHQVVHQSMMLIVKMEHELEVNENVQLLQLQWLLWYKLQAILIFFLLLFRLPLLLDHVDDSHFPHHLDQVRLPLHDHKYMLKLIFCELEFYESVLLLQQQ